MLTASHTDPYAGPLALLGTVVATSVFTIGFLSHRAHAALTRARQVLQDDARRTDASPEQHEDNAEHAKDIVADAQSYLVLTANVFLAALTGLAAWWGWAPHMGRDGKLTLVGFCGVELVIVLLGLHDHTRVRNALNEQLEMGTTSVQLDRGRSAFRSELWAGLPRRQARQLPARRRNPS